MLRLVTENLNISNCPSQAPLVRKQRSIRRSPDMTIMGLPSQASHISSKSCDASLCLRSPSNPRRLGWDFVEDDEGRKIDIRIELKSDTTVRADIEKGNVIHHRCTHTAITGTGRYRHSGQALVISSSSYF